MSTTATRTPRRAPMDDRIRQRRIEVRRAGARRRRRVVGSLVILALVAAGAVAISRSPLFAITGVRVEGVSGPQADVIKDTAQVARGQNLLSADLDDALVRTTALPWVANVEIRRVPPSTVVIDVTPRRPVAILSSAAGSWLVDADGVVIAEAAGQSLPRIELASATGAVPGVKIDDPAAHNALDLYAALPRDMRAALRSIEAVGPRTVLVEVALDRLARPKGYAKGRTTIVRMGTASDVGDQVVTLRALLGQLRSSRAGVPSEVDVRVPSNPVVVP